jgi:hypothetical protein
MLSTDLEKVNIIIQDATTALIPALVAEQAKYGIKHGSDGMDKIKRSFRKRDGMINKVTIKIKKSGIYREKGAGKGYGGKKGSKWIDSKGQQKSTNPNSLGKAGTGTRQAAPWFNPVVEKYADQLANKLADEFVEIAFNNLKLK